MNGLDRTSCGSLLQSEMVIGKNESRVLLLLLHLN